MRGTLRRKGKGWEVIVPAGRQSARRCDRCSRRAWVRDWTRDACPRARCGGRLGEAALERRTISELYRTKAEAEAALARHVNARNQGRDLPGKRPFHEAMEDYLRTGGTRGDLRPRTLKRYRDLSRLYVLPVLGDLALERIRSDDVRAMLGRMKDKGRAPRTIQQARALTRAVFARAVADEVIIRNPVVGTRPPRVERANVTALRAEHVLAVMRSAVGTVWEVPLVLAAATGARRSETLALTWGDIDMERRAVRIARGLQVRTEKADDGSTTEVMAAKTTAGTRTVPLPVYAVERLRTHRAEQNERRLRLGEDYATADLVCANASGGPLSPDAWTHAFKRFARRVGVPHARLHDLRHHVAVVLGAGGVEARSVSSIMGHASPGFTLSAYGDAWDEHVSKAADVMDRVLGGEVGNGLEI